MPSIPDRWTAPCWYWPRNGASDVRRYRRLLEDFSERGLIRVDSNPVTSIIDMVCVKSWMIAGRLIENPTCRQTVKAYEGVRIFLFNGQQLETLAPQFGKEEERKTDRRNGRGNGWLVVHESDPFQSYYRRNRNSGNRNGSNTRKRHGKYCGKYIEDADNTPVLEDGDTLSGSRKWKQPQE